MERKCEYCASTSRVVRLLYYCHGTKSPTGKTVSFLMDTCLACRRELGLDEHEVTLVPGRDRGMVRWQPR